MLGWRFRNTFHYLWMTFVLVCFNNNGIRVARGGFVRTAAVVNPRHHHICSLNSFVGSTTSSSAPSSSSSPSSSRPACSGTRRFVATNKSNNINNNSNLDMSFSTVSTNGATTATTPSSSHPNEMTEDERYLFDLNGYLIVRGVLTAEEVARANAAIDRHSHEMVERSDAALRNAVRGTKLYGTGPGRKDLGRVLEWSSCDSTIFKSILAHPRLVPLFHGILGKGYRMDHLPFVISQDRGSEGFQLHGGTVDCGTGEYNPHLAYTCHHGMIRCALLGCNVMLADHNPGDGGFCVVPGSHKSNFKMPKGMMDGERYAEYVQQPATRAGDVVLFSEGTVHGALPWTPQDRQRRVCLFRFAPATNAYGRSYFDADEEQEDGSTTMWPKAMYEGLNDAQRAVLEPPYANRLDRPNIVDPVEGTVEITTRSQRKKDHDRQLFGTKYF